MKSLVFPVAVLLGVIFCPPGLTMLPSGQVTVSSERRSSSATAVTITISPELVDEEKQPASQRHTSCESQRDKEIEEDEQNILNAAWGRHGKIWMWVGYVRSKESDTLC